MSSSWFLDNPDLDWKPADSLIRFMEKARRDGKPLVYIGFGSITVPDPKSVSEHIVDAVMKSMSTLLSLRHDMLIRVWCRWCTRDHFEGLVESDEYEDRQ